MTKDQLKLIFSKRLHEAMVDKGWNQSELARRATAHLPNGTIGRDVISHYMRGVSLPQPARLEALSKALGVEATSLLPERPSRKRPTFSMTQLGDGRVQVSLDKTLTLDQAARLISIINEDEE